MEQITSSLDLYDTSSAGVGWFSDSTAILIFVALLAVGLLFYLGVRKLKKTDRPVEEPKPTPVKKTQTRRKPRMKNGPSTASGKPKTKPKQRRPRKPKGTQEKK